MRRLLAILTLAVLLLAGAADARGNQGCTRTRGYWSTHHCRAGNDDSSPRRLSWPPVTEGAPCAQEDAPFLCPDLTGYGVFLLSEEDGNVWVQAAKQLKTVELNQASGAAVPAPVQEAADTLTPLLINYCGAKAFPADSAARGAAEEAKTFLDTYNNGQWPDGPRHCDDDNAPPCVVYSWSEWSPCEGAVCADETGNRTRTQRIECPGEPAELVTQTEACQPAEPPCCSWSAWSAFGDCSGVCADDEGVRTRSRTETCLNSPDTRTETEEIPCKRDVPCCAWTAWSAYGPCSGECADEQGTQERSRTRECLNAPPSEWVTETQNQDCNRDVPCCEWSCWSPFSACSAPCGDVGVQTRSRTLECLNGTAAHATQEDEEPCNRDPCCTAPEYTEWTACSAECGPGGTRTRVKVVSCIDTGAHVRTEEEDCAGPVCCPDNCAVCDEQGDCLECEPHHYGPHCEFSVCVECLPHRYGPHCVRCPDACPEACDDGLAGTGACLH